MRHLVVVSVVALLVGLALAASEERPASMTAAGQVTAVDTKANTLAVKLEEQGKTRDVTFVVDAQTRILEDGAPIQLPQLKSGDRVTVTYHDLGGKTVAMNIGVQRKAG